MSRNSKESQPLDLAARIAELERKAAEAEARAAEAEKRATEAEQRAAAGGPAGSVTPGVTRIPAEQLRAGLTAAVVVYTADGRRFELERNSKGYWDFTADRTFFKAGSRTVPTKGISGRLARVLGVFAWAVTNPEIVGQMHDAAVEAERDCVAAEQAAQIAADKAAKPFTQETGTAVA
jgi:hypothetical protein